MADITAISSRGNDEITKTIQALQKMTHWGLLDLQNFLAFPWDEALQAIAD